MSETFLVKKPRLPIQCKIEIGEPKIAGCPVYINVTLKIEQDEITSISGNPPSTYIGKIGPTMNGETGSNGLYIEVPMVSALISRLCERFR